MKKRKREKIIKKSVIIYDFASKPRSAEIMDIFNLFREGIVVYDSSMGFKPEIYPKRNSRVFKFKNEK